MAQCFDGEVTPLVTPFEQRNPETSILNYFDSEQYLCFESQEEIDEYVKNGSQDKQVS